MTTWGGALYFGPEPDSSRYYSAPMPSAPAGDFAIFLLVQFETLWVGDPTVAQPNPIGIAQNYAAGGTGGNDADIRVNARNIGTASERGKINFRIATAGNNLLNTNTRLTGTSVFGNGDIVLIVLQSSGGTIQLKTCKPGGSVVAEASQARNAAFTTLSLGGAWHLGRSLFGGYIQALGVAAQALSDTDIANLAGGTDPDTIVASGNRLALWSLDSPAASIASAWGAAGAATQVGSWANQPTASPIVPNAAARLDVTNQPIRYGVVSVADDGTGPVHTWTGTYTGFTPSTFQGRLEALDGTTVVDWTDLGSFTASAGSWSGTMAVPPGGLYRLQIRDKTDTTKVWRGASPWSCCPTLLTIGQSPHSYFEAVYKGSGPAITGDLYVCWASVPNQMVKATKDIVGAGLAYLANTWDAASGGLPLAVVAASVVGTSSTNWKDKTAATWTPMLAGLDYLHPQRVLAAWLNGASDAGFTAATIKANLDAILGNFDTDVTGTRGIGYRFSMLPHNRDTSNTPNNAKVRTAQYEWARDHAQAGTKVLIGPWWGDMQTDTEATGTARAATSTSITLAADDPATGTSVYVGSTVTILSGTGAGQSRTITAFNITTKVATVAAWTTTPDATSVYRVTGSSPHPTIVGAMDRLGPRYARHLARVWGYDPDGGRGPALTAATYPNGGDGSAIDVAVTHRYGAALTTQAGGADATGLAGFEVTEDNWATSETISSAVVADAGTVRLTLAAPPSSLAALKVRYGQGAPVDTAQWAATEAGGLADLLADDVGNLVEFTTTDLAVTEAPPAGPEPGALAVVGGTLGVVGGTLGVVA